MTNAQNAEGQEQKTGCCGPEESKEGVQGGSCHNSKQADDVEAKLKEALEFKNKYFYLAAEMENMRKRYQREMEQVTKFGTEKVLSGLVEVVDNFDRTVNALKKDSDEKVKNIVIGIEMVRNQFLQTLSDNGLTIVEALGKQFDPNLHEALAQRADGNAKDDQVLEEFEKGYQLNGRLLRAAKVVIAKNN